MEGLLSKRLTKKRHQDGVGPFTPVELAFPGSASLGRKIPQRSEKSSGEKGDVPFSPKLFFLFLGNRGGIRCKRG